MSDLAAARTIRTYETYVEAETAAALLAAGEFPPEHLELQVRGLRFVAPEWRRVPLRLVILGLAMLAAAGIAVVAGVLAWQQAVASLLFAAPALAVLGLCVASRRHERLMGAGYAVADGYDVVVPEEFAEEAIRLLQR